MGPVLKGYSSTRTGICVEPLKATEGSRDQNKPEIQLARTRGEEAIKTNVEGEVEIIIIVSHVVGDSRST